MGNWVWLRSVLLLTLLAFVDAVTLIDRLRSWIAGIGNPATTEHWWIPQVSAEAIYAFLPSVLILVFFLCSEISQWVMRTRAVASVSLLEHMKKHYDLVAKSSIDNIVAENRPLGLSFHGLMGFLARTT
jgi:hypothetical protein